MNVMFIIAQFRKDNSIVDIGWGLGVLAVTIGLYLKTGYQSIVHLVFLLLIGAWALRLAGYIFIRNRGTGEDYRYAAWRSYL